jgi:hypothetical protein
LLLLADVVMSLQAIDCVRDAYDLAGSRRFHGLWANVQLAEYQLLLEPRRGELVESALHYNINNDTATWYGWQGNLRCVCKQEKQKTD